MTSLGFSTKASGVKKTPSGKAIVRLAATFIARRVFPVPGVPTKVTRRTSGWRSRLAASAISRSRPKKTVVWAGRLVGVGAGVGEEGGVLAGTVAGGAVLRELAC